MDDELQNKLIALRTAKSLGCSGAHFSDSEIWLPCSSDAELLRLLIKREDPNKILPSDIEEWSGRRTVKGKKKKRKYEQLRERGVLGIDTLPSGGLVSTSISTSSLEDENINEKAVIAPMSPRDTDVDVFTDIESARARSRQLGCIGVSRRVSRAGKTVWMPCTNMSDYARVSGTTALGRRYQQQQRNRQVEGAVRTILNSRGLARKKSIYEELNTKSLGKNIKRGTRFATETFDPKAIDGDSDGLVQEGTAFERPGIDINLPDKPSNLLDLSPQDNPINTWFRSLNPKDREDRFGPPIEAMAMLPDRDVRDITAQILKGGFRSEKKPPQIDNPNATAKNPFADLGGRKMGQIILDRVKPENKNKQNPTTYFIGGTVGAGKDTVVGHLQGLGILPRDDAAAVIDPDFIKAGLPGYRDGSGASAVHQQSRVVTDKVMNDATKEGMDIIVLGTGKRDEHTAAQKRAGHHVVAHFVYAPSDVADQRLRARNASGGRQISAMSQQIAGEIPFHISRMLDQNTLDEFYLWDNSGDMAQGFKPKLIAEKKPGQVLKIYDKAKFEDFAGGKKWADSWETKFNNNDKTISNNMNPNGMRSRIGDRITAGITVRQKRPKEGPDSSQKYKSIDEIISDAIIQSNDDIQQALDLNPYTKGRKGTAKLLQDMEIDQEKQTAVRVMLRRALKDSPALFEFAREFGLPPIVITNREPRVNAFDGMLEAGGSWNRSHIASYLNYEGIIVINPNVGNTELVGVGNDKRTPEYVIRHEIGHAIDAMSARNKDAAKAKKKAFAEYIGRVKEYLKTAPETERDMFYTGQLEAGPNNNVPSELIGDELSLARSISDYATVNRGEYIAEAFAHLTAPPSERVRALRNEHIEMLAEFLGIDVSSLRELQGRISKNN